VAESRVTKIEREKGTRKERERERERERGAAQVTGSERARRRGETDSRLFVRSVAGGEDGPPSKSSLVTMNGPNESRGPIKDYSRRRFAPTAPGRRRLGVCIEGAKNERYSLSEDESKPGSFTPA